MNDWKFKDSYIMDLKIEGNPCGLLCSGVTEYSKCTFMYLFYFFVLFFSLFAWVSVSLPWSVCQGTEREHKRFCYLRRNKGYFLRNNECSCGPRERIDVIKGLVSLFRNVPLEVAWFWFLKYKQFVLTKLRQIISQKCLYFSK